MNIKIIRTSDNTVSKWSGGTTSQVYIYPENAEYSKRNFLFRLSMAAADIEDSVYTHLCGVTRYIVSLNGTAELIHSGERKVRLEPFGKVDCFDGGEYTEAHGAIVDFNMMLSGGAEGEMLVVNASRQKITPDMTHTALFAYEKCVIAIDGRAYELNAGDCILFTDIKDSVYADIHCGTMRIIRCNIKC